MKGTWADYAMSSLYISKEEREDGLEVYKYQYGGEGNYVFRHITEDPYTDTFYSDKELTIKLVARGD